MSVYPLEYLPSVDGESTFLPDLSRVLPIAMGRAFQHQRILLDSFDGRLHKNGWMLEESRQGRQREWILRSLPRGLEVQRTQIGGTVHFASQLPPGPLQNRLQPLLEGRALLPQIRLLAKTQPLTAKDDRGQIVVIANWETFVWDYPTQDPQPTLPGRLTLWPGVGGEEVLLALANRLQEQLGLSPADRNLWILALSRLNAPPGRYSTKLDFHFQPEDRAEVVFRHLSLHLLHTLETNLPGVLADTDDEFLHDLRVAVRRTRVVLARMEGVLAPEPSEQFQKEFAWLQAISGPVRDWDVYRQHLPRYHAMLPDKCQTWLEPLAAHLARERQRSRRTLLAALRNQRCQRLLREWRILLEAPLAFNGETNDQPIARLANGWIWQQYRKARRRAQSLTAESPAEDFHTLRKDLKTLRYLMEFLASLYPAEGIGDRIRRTRQLLEYLGHHQDLAVQIDTLHRSARTMLSESPTQPDTLLALGALMGTLLRRQHKQRKLCLRSLGSLFDKAEQKKFRGLFRDGRSAATVSVVHTADPPDPVPAS